MEHYWCEKWTFICLWVRIKPLEYRLVEGFFLSLICVSKKMFSDARSMAKDVHSIIVKVVMEKGQMTNSQALNYVKKMEQQKRYSADVWS